MVVTPNPVGHPAKRRSRERRTQGRKMESAFLLVALLSSCGKPTQKQSPQITQLSDAYAKSALICVLAIQSDVSTTEDRNGEAVVTGGTQSKIDEADSEARAAPEVSMTHLLRQIYKSKLANNDLRKAEHDLIEAEIKNYGTDLEYHTSHPSVGLTETKSEIVKQAAQFDQNDADTTKKQTACLEPLEQALRDRSPIIPEPCIQAYLNENAEPAR